jgi:hypothetical protein
LPELLLKKGKGYAYVSTDVHGSSETLWVPLQNIRPKKTDEHVQQSDDCPSDGGSSGGTNRTDNIQDACPYIKEKMFSFILCEESPTHLGAN